MTYTEPALPLLILIGLVGVARAWRKSAGGRRPWLETFSLIGILVISTPAGAWLLSRPLEVRYPFNPIPNENADAIVVLAGTVIPPNRGRPYALPSQDTYLRVQHAVWLYRYWKPLPILACGGGTPGRPYSETMRRVLLSEGIPAEMIWTESASNNTHENAVYGAEILRAHNVSRVVLVVEASGMPRASMAFRKAGITVFPSPVRYTQLSRDLSDLLPGWKPIQATGDTVHELVGIVWYKLRGWI